MSEVSWIRSHVRLLTAEVWEKCCVQVDEDGDIPFRYGTAAGWISVLESETPMVRVWAHAVRGVKASAKLLAELNEIQLGTVSVRVEHCHGTVMVSQTISPVGLTAPVLRQALESVSHVADDIGGLLVAVFGGGTPFEADLDVDEEAS